MILIAGDSLSSGNIGIGYTTFLPERDYLIRGIDGDTMRGVTERVLRYLKQRRVTDGLEGIIIECGSNDVLLPWLLQSGNPVFREAAAGLVNERTAPEGSPASFASVYDRQLGRIVAAAAEAGLSPDRIAVTDIPPVGEDLSSPIQGIRAEYNRRVQELAAQAGAQLIGLGSVLETAYSSFQPVPPGTYFMDEPGNFVRDAAFIADDEAKAAELSRKRGLTLTVDGLHLNGRGARIAARAFTGFIQSL